MKKKFATLLPNNWLAETPQPLAVKRLGRQSAERERISSINSERSLIIADRLIIYIWSPTNKGRAILCFF
ncbi:hypothetical protein ABGT24_11985 [Peribacillus frigoritolerans]|uniref:hypothetical protein n=1 Tax=Peribacillus frigoritolerans TaxID=450367 RepID=UPI00345CD906